MGRGLMPASRRGGSLVFQGVEVATPPRRERRTKGGEGPPEDDAPEVETPVAREDAGEAEVERGSEPTSEEMEE